MGGKDKRPPDRRDPGKADPQRRTYERTDKEIDRKRTQWCDVHECNAAFCGGPH